MKRLKKMGQGKIVRKVGFWGISSQFLCMVSLFGVGF